MRFTTALFPPPIPQPLSTPAGAERGVNSHIWFRRFGYDTTGRRHEV